MSNRYNYYDILGLTPQATDEEVKRAYWRLAKLVHPDANPTLEASDAFKRLQLAYEVLGDSDRRMLYDAQLADQQKNKVVPFRLNLTISHPQLKFLNDPQMLYAVAEIKALENYQSKRPRLNLCLVLDRSRSMDGARLQQAKEAAIYLLDHLDAEDCLSVIAFSDRARLILQGPVGSERGVAKADIRNIYPDGGTELLQGLKTGLSELSHWRAPGTLDHLILLTDGQTYGDDEGCLEVSAIAGQDKVGLTLLGLGNDWNEKLLDEMAARSGGYAAFIDSPAKVVTVFQERFKELADVVAQDVKLTCHLQTNTQLKEIYRLTPDIARVKLHDTTINIGSIERSRPIFVLLELVVTATALGPSRIARVQVSGETITTERARAHAESDIIIEFSTAGNPNWRMPGEVANIVGRVTAYKVQERAMADVEEGDYTRATNRLKALATHLLNFGEIELARVALLEADALTRTGHLSDEGRKRIHYGTRSLSQTVLLNKDKGG